MFKINCPFSREFPEVFAMARSRTALDESIVLVSLEHFAELQEAADVMDGALPLVEGEVPVMKGVIFALREVTESYPSFLTQRQLLGRIDARMGHGHSCIDVLRRTLVIVNELAELKVRRAAVMSTQPPQLPYYMRPREGGRPR